jgi:hypothetical protein
LTVITAPFLHQPAELHYEDDSGEDCDQDYGGDFSIENDSVRLAKTHLSVYGNCRQLNAPGYRHGYEQYLSCQYGHGESKPSPEEHSTSPFEQNL